MSSVQRERLEVLTDGVGLRLEALNGGPAELGWGLTCGVAACFSLAALGRAPAPVYVVELARRSNAFTPAARRLGDEERPRLGENRVLARGPEPLAAVALAKTSGGGTVTATLTDFDPTTPWVTLKKPAPDGRYEPLCVGTTTSARMVRFTEPLGATYGVRAICGKGGLPDEAIEPMRRLGMVYLAIVGGAAALETTQIEEIEEVYWEELMPECLWKFRVKDFGPLTVAIDSHGTSLYHDVQEEAKKRLEDLYARL